MGLFTFSNLQSENAVESRIKVLSKEVLNSKTFVLMISDSVITK